MIWVSMDFPMIINPIPLFNGDRAKRVIISKNNRRKVTYKIIEELAGYRKIAGGYLPAFAISNPGLVAFSPLFKDIQYSDFCFSPINALGHAPHIIIW